MRALKSVLLDRPWLVVGVLVLCGATYWALGTRTQDHHVRVAFDSAVNLTPGMDVQAAGVDVGKVSDVSYATGQAIVELGIDDGAAWPLHQGATATIRFGSTAGNGNRRIELTPGPSSAPTIPDGGVIGRGQASAPVEIDEVLNTFDASTRDDLRAFFTNSSAALRPSAPALNRGLRDLDNAVRPVGAVMRDLADSRRSLSRLISSGSRVSRVLDERRTQIASLVDVTGQTFGVFARNAKATQDTIGAMPATFRQATGTLARLNPSLASLEATLTALDPGIRALPALARISNPTVRRLRAAARDGAALANTAQAAAPATTTLLTKLTPLTGKLTPVLERSLPMAKCIAPYVPDLTGLLSSWAGYTQEYDGIAHYARARIMEGLSTFQENPIGVTATTKLLGLDYNGIPAPGAFVGQPRYMPECGVTAREADPRNDWESP